MPRLFQNLPEGPLDIIGDIHGEIDALHALLERLGVDIRHNTAQRPLVFVGDLIDRGPDSAAVVSLFAQLQDAGLAFGVMGNHELNLLCNERKEGNGWYFQHDDYAQINNVHIPFNARTATESERQFIHARLSSLPMVLERADLRVVHACWDAPSAARLPEVGDAAALSLAFQKTIKADLLARGVSEQAKAERAEFANLKEQSIAPNRYLSAVAEEAVLQQCGNPVKVLSSGIEVEIKSPDKPYFTGGKWRFLDRERWWQRPVDRPTVIGHYWRRRDAHLDEDKQDVWGDVPPFDWKNGVFCVDYSVGRRYVERLKGRHTNFNGGLAALRWPERMLVFDDQSEAIPTGNFAL